MFCITACLNLTLPAGWPLLPIDCPLLISLNLSLHPLTHIEWPHCAQKVQKTSHVITVLVKSIQCFSDTVQCSPLVMPPVRSNGNWTHKRYGPISEHHYYRATHLLADLGWVDFDLGCSTGHWAVLQLWCCPSKTVEHPKSKSTQSRSARRWVTL